MNKYLLIIFIVFIKSGFCLAQLNSDSINVGSTKIKSITDTTLIDFSNLISKVPERNYQNVLNELLKKNVFLNVFRPASIFINSKKTSQGKEYLFYLIITIALIFGFFKVFYATYFNNIFRLFFNTSLRQNQLTDLLLQARLPSLIFNLFFTVIAGIYVWLLLNNYIIKEANLRMLLICITVITGIYVLKFFVLKFVGWLTGMSEAANTYIFIVFLINKIIGVLLLPVNILIAFALPEALPSVIICSFLILGILFILRFFRSYGLLQNQLEVGKLPFISYILAIEILPLFMLFKWIKSLI